MASLLRAVENQKTIAQPNVVRFRENTAQSQRSSAGAGEGPAPGRGAASAAAYQPAAAAAAAAAGAVLIPPPKPQDQHQHQPPPLSANRNLRFALSGLRARYAKSQGRLRDVFRSWDEDKSGDVDAGELRTALVGLGYSAVTESDAVALIENIDLNGDGSIQYDDFVRLVCGEEHGEGSGLDAGGKRLPSLASPADLDEIGRFSSAAEVNLVGHMFTLGGKLFKRVISSEEVASARRSGIADVATGRGSDSLREAVMASEDAAVASVRAAFAGGLGAREKEGRAGLVHTLNPVTAASGITHFSHRVALSSLPPATQITELTARGVYAQPVTATLPPLQPDWYTGNYGNTLTSVISDPKFQNECGDGESSSRDYDHTAVRPVERHDMTVERYDVKRNQRPLDPVIPEYLDMPISPMERTSQIRARRRAHAPALADMRDDALTMPGGVDATALLSPSPGGFTSHPLSLASSTARCDFARSFHPAAVVTFCPDVNGALRGVPPRDAAERAAAAPPAGALDRSLTATARVPMRGEIVFGAMSNDGNAGIWDPRTIHPVGGAQCIVSGSIGVQVESISVPGRLLHLTARDRLVNAASRRLALSTRAVDLSVTLPISGQVTATHVLGAPAPERRSLTSPLRLKALESSRSAFFASSPNLHPPPRSLVPDIDAGTSLLRDHLKDRGSTIARRMGGVFIDTAAVAAGGDDAGGGLGGGASSAHMGTLESHGSTHVAGGSRTAQAVARAVRAEGQRTTYLIAPPSSMRTEFSSEDPSWHFASAAAIAATQTRIPEQHLHALCKISRIESAAAAINSSRKLSHAIADADYAFHIVNQEQVVERKRAERKVYADAVFARKSGQETMLSMPFPVPAVRV